MHSFSHSLIHSCIHSFIHSVIHNSLTQSFIHAFIQAFIHSFIRSFIHSFINSFIHPFIDALQRGAVLEMRSLERRPGIARLPNRQRWSEAPGEWRHCGPSICRKPSLGVEPPKMCTWHTTPPGDCVPLIPGEKSQRPKSPSHGHLDWIAQTTSKLLKQASSGLRR